MVMVKVDDKQWYEDKTFLTNLNIYLSGMKDNDDLVIVLDGAERAGKSLRARQIAKYCANQLGTTFSNENIHFTLQDYLDFSLKASEYTVCVLDEARNVLNKRSSTSKANKRFTNYLSECAKKRQVHILCIPAFHDLDRYVTNWRMKFVLHLNKWYEQDKDNNYILKRGKYHMYMNDLYLKDSYNYPYRYPRRWETIGQFTGVEVFNEKELKEYENKKDENLMKKYHSESLQEELNNTQKMWKTRWVKLVRGVMRDTKLKYDDIGEYCSMNTTTVRTNVVQSQID